MATSTPVVDGVSGSPAVASTQPAPVRLPVIFLLLSVVVGAAIAALGIGGVLYYLARSGRLSMQGASMARVESATPAETHLMALDPLLVNLADEGGTAYLRLSLVLRVTDAAARKDSKTKIDKSDDAAMDEIRDTALTVLGRQTSESLLAPDGKERLKTELKRSMAQHNPNLKITDLFFTDFLVQR
jgi:flagellar protein FliL